MQLANINSVFEQCCQRTRIAYLPWASAKDVKIWKVAVTVPRIFVLLNPLLYHTSLKGEDEKLLAGLVVKEKYTAEILYTEVRSVLHQLH